MPTVVRPDLAALGGYLLQNRLGYEVTPFGSLIAGAVLTLARTPGMFPRDERLMRALAISPTGPT